MKTLISLILTVSSSLAVAGGSGGGGVMMDTMRVNREALGTHGGGVLSPKEIVFHMGQNNGLVKFAYAQLINKQWDIKEVTLPVSEISNDESAVKALDESRNLNQWVELK